MLRKQPSVCSAEPSTKWREPSLTCSDADFVIANFMCFSCEPKMNGTSIQPENQYIGSHHREFNRLEIPVVTYLVSIWLLIMTIEEACSPTYPTLDQSQLFLSTQSTIRYTVLEWIENNKNPKIEGHVGETDGPEKATQTFAMKVVPDQRSSDAIPDSSTHTSPTKKIKTASTTAHG